MNEGEKLLLSLFVVIVGSLGIPLCYAIHRAWKIAKIRQMGRYLEMLREGKDE